MRPYGPTNDTSDCAEFSLNRLGVAITREKADILEKFIAIVAETPSAVALQLTNRKLFPVTSLIFRQPW